MSSDFENNPFSTGRVRRKLNIRALYAGAAVIAAVVILVLCMTVFFNISEVEVRGVTLYTDDQIINAGGIYEDMNLVRTDVFRAEKRLTDNLVYIDEVKVSKEYPSTVVIDCVEAEKAADIQFEGGYYVLSTSGRILEADNSAPTGGIPVITGFKFYTAQDRIDNGEELTVLPKPRKEQQNQKKEPLPVKVEEPAETQPEKADPPKKDPPKRFHNRKRNGNGPKKANSEKNDGKQ